MRMIFSFALFLLAATGAATPASATVERFSCVFDEYVSPDTEGTTRGDTLRIEFMVDGTGHAFAVGQNVYPVRLVVGSQGLTFLEELGTGAVQSTTIHSSGKAVHSRHTMLSVTNEIVPSQSYGTCK